MTRILHLLRNFVLVDYGWRDVMRLVVSTVIAGAAVGIGKGIVHRPDGALVFDWQAFWIIVGASVAITVVSNLWEAATTGKKLLYPVRGQVWMRERKAQTSAVLKRVNHAIENRPISRDEAIRILTDILDCVVSHVRDIRGNHREGGAHIFANLLLLDGNEAVVVARDSDVQGSQHSRQTPQRYPLASLLVGRAVVARHALSIGDLQQEYSEAPKDKPYRSILAIPIISGVDKPVVIGAVSVDSSRPYLFSSFQRGKVENELEDTLQPYLQTICIVLERLISPDSREMLRVLLGEAASSSGGNRE